MEKRGGIDYNLEIRSRRFSLRGSIQARLERSMQICAECESLNARITSNNRIVVCAGAYQRGDTHRANV